MKVQRLPDNPIITLAMGDKRDLEGNINGPSLIRVPDWIENPLGRYYLYFAHHNGTYIRLAYADEVAGPWQVYAPGTLKLEEAYAIQHVASPDVHVDNDRREIRMYYHSPVPEGGQRTKVATSEDGIRFTAAPEVLGLSYFRVFQWDGWHYAIGMPGVLYRSKDGLTDFQQRPTLFPDSIYQSSIDLTPDWMSWKPTDQQVMLRPELGYEGADLPNEPSQRGAIMEPVNQLRDPCIFEDGNNTYLLYSIAGEQGIALAKLSE